MALRPSNVFCTECKSSYAEDGGCDICEVAKNHILWPGGRSTGPQRGKDVRTDPEHLSQQAVRLLATNMERLEREMTQHGAGKYGKYYDEHAKQAALLSRATSQVVDAVRKLDERNAKLAETLGFSERLELMLNWADGLPFEQQDQLWAGFRARMASAKAIPAEIE